MPTQPQSYQQQAMAFNTTAGDLQGLLGSIFTPEAMEAPQSANLQQLQQAQQMIAQMSSAVQGMLQQSAHGAANGTNEAAMQATSDAYAQPNAPGSVSSSLASLPASFSPLGAGQGTNRAEPYGTTAPEHIPIREPNGIMEVDSETRNFVQSIGGQVEQ